MAAIGLTTGAFSADDDFGRSGTKWQNDSSWGDFYITTLSTYKGPANLKNALIHSDNIYFAKAALKIEAKSNKFTKKYRVWTTNRVSTNNKQVFILKQ